MNYSLTQPFALVYLNAAQLPASVLSAWQMEVAPPRFRPSAPYCPLLYAMVETGLREPAHGANGWSCHHQPGPLPINAARQSGGGISLLYHADCPIKALPAYSGSIPPALSPNAPPSSAVVCAIVQPRHCQPFLLATVYLQPHISGDSNAVPRLQHLTGLIDAARAAHPSLPLLVVGDFNCHHPDWKCPTILVNASPISTPSIELASWIDSSALELLNPDGVPTRISPTSQSVIDLVLCDTPLLASAVMQQPDSLHTDHLPFTIHLELPALATAPRAQDLRPRVAWNHHENPSVWQAALPTALAAAFAPLQPLLDSLAQPIPAGTTAQPLLDHVYAEVERTLLSTCIDVVDTRVVTIASKPWMRYPGIREAHAERKAAIRAYRHDDCPANLHRFRTARRAWTKLSAEAKLQSFSDLCSHIMEPDDKLRWSLFKRTTPSIFTSLAAITHHATGELPTSHAASLDHLRAAFLASGVPPAPTDPAAYTALTQRVDQWADSAGPTIPLHPSDGWAFTTADVKEQCTHQHTNTAPGPDALLPIFLAHAGEAAWAALAALYTFSWTHAVLPQAWREANVMALYKGDGPKGDSSSYRPISMTSILIRTFEHLIHRRLVTELDARDYLSPTQFGYRKARSTADAIHYLLSGLQGRMGQKGRKAPQGRKGQKQQCAVLFLDISKAFDRVDHPILLQRLHDAGIRGKAWLWIKAFLTGRLMRCVDASHHSDWQVAPYGVPQGCVLSPLLFLIFINQLQRTILDDPDCDLVAPLFFADDGALGPNPLSTHTVSAADFEPTYALHLSNAICHLDRWCSDSRMAFGAKKTQLVVFTTRQQPDTSAYSNLQLCGFTIAIAQGYHYLGLHLDHRLSWATHQEAAIRKARAASFRVTRVALRARETSFEAVRALVLGYLIPSFAYGALFWGRDPDLAHLTRRSLQGLIAQPLRVALNLPRTSHQTSVLTHCHVPTVRSLVLREQLAFLQRVCSPTALPTDHPTRQLHEAAIVLGNTQRPYNIMASSALTPLSVYLAASVYPRLLHDPVMVAKVDPATRTALMPHGAHAEWHRGVTYWTHLNKARRTHARQSGYTLAHLRDAITWTTTSAQHLTRAAARDIRAQYAHAEWQSEHQPQPALILTPTTAPSRQHPTSAPLTQCKPAPGLPPYLRRWSKSSHRERVLRARFLLGRARTGSVRLRFAKAADRASIVELCTAPACQPPALPAPAPAPPADTIEHCILHCTRHDQSRRELGHTLDRLQLPLTLSTVLVAHAPQPPLSSPQLASLLRDTATFLATVEAERLAAGLVPLDTG
jgi:hypothetical protein